MIYWLKLCRFTVSVMWGLFALVVAHIMFNTVVRQVNAILEPVRKKKE